MEDCNWIMYIKQFQVICLQETWSVDCNYFLEGYKAFYVPATATTRGRPKGGMVTFISVALSCKTRRAITSNSGIIGLILTGENCMLGLVNFYNAVNSCSVTSQLSAPNVFIINSMRDCIHNLMIMGDFNVHPCGDVLLHSISDLHCPRLEGLHLEHTTEGEFFIDLLNDLDLSLTMGLMDPTKHFEIPSFKGHGRGTFIDYVLITLPMQFFVDSFVIEYSEFSDHNPLTVHLRGPWIANVDTSLITGMVSTTDGRRRLKWSKITPDLLYKDIKSLCADEILVCTQEGPQPRKVLEAYQSLSVKVTKLLSVPAKKSESVGPKWFNRDCSKAARNLRLALAAKPRIKETVQLCRKHYKSIITKHKECLREEAWREILDPSTLRCSSRFWALMKKPFLVQVPGDGLECYIPKEEWESHFKQLYCSPVEERTIFAPTDNVKMISFSRGEVMEGIVGLTAGKAPGPDGIPPDLFKSEPSFWSPILESVFNAAVKYGCPQSWGVSTIVPVFKKGDKSSPNCYRPISLIDSMVKLIGRILLQRLSDWTMENNIMSIVQYRFCSGRSTVTQCLNLFFMEKSSTLWLIRAPFTSPSWTCPQPSIV
ncbi:uncharacterized protein LOC144767468 [Lissotriton helveticus]